jgi:hypothetical protein
MTFSLNEPDNAKTIPMHWQANRQFIQIEPIAKPALPDTTSGVFRREYGSICRSGRGHQKTRYLDIHFLLDDKDFNTCNTPTPITKAWPQRYSPQDKHGSFFSLGVEMGEVLSIAVIAFALS